MRELLTISEAAKRLTISPTTLRRLIARGELVYVQLGQRLIRITNEAIEQYIQSAEEKSRSNARRTNVVLLNSSVEEKKFFAAASKGARRDRRKSSKPGSARLSSIK